MAEDVSTILLQFIEKFLTTFYN